MDKGASLTAEQLREVTGEIVGKLSKERIYQARLSQYWHDYVRKGEEIPDNEVEKLKGKVSEVREAILEKKAVSRPILGMRCANKEVDIASMIGQSKPLMVSAARFNDFFRPHLHRLKKIRKGLQSLQLLQSNQGGSGKGRFRYQNPKKAKTRANHVGRLQRQMDKIASLVHTDIELVEKTHKFIVGYLSYDQNQRRIWKDFRYDTKVRLSFAKFRRVCQLLGYTYRSILKVYKETDDVKEGRIRLLGQLIELREKKPETVYFFDCSSFNWTQRDRKCWQVRGKVVAFPPITDFRSVHLLMCVTFTRVVSFQLVHDNLSSELVASFLQQTIAHERQNLTHKEINFVLDNARMHRTKLIQTLVSATRIHLHFLIPRNPYFNLIEFVFRYLKTKNTKSSCLRK